MIKRIALWGSVASIISLILVFILPNGQNFSQRIIQSIFGQVYNTGPIIQTQGEGKVSFINQSDKSQERFFEAIRIGDIKTIEVYIREGMNPHANADDRQLPIYLANNTTNSVEVLHVLHNHGLDLNYPFHAQRSTGPQDNRLLYWATQKENKALVDELLKYGADPNFETEIRGVGAPFKQSLLRFAEQRAKQPNASQATGDIVQVLVSAGARLSAQEVERERVPTAAEVEHSLKTCAEEMNRTPPAQWYEEASRFKMLQPKSYSVREAILAELNSALLTGSVSDSTAGVVLRRAIDKNCGRHRSS